MKAGRYNVPATRHRVSEEVKHSRFIATVDYAPTSEDAMSLLADLRREFPDATHHCWAYVVGPPGRTQNTGSSDDGEPGGTAGRPILSVLLGSDVGDVAVIVTRYFGGVKLGKGGLARAYGGVTQQALRELPRREHIRYVAGTVTVPYAGVDAVKGAVERCEVEISGETYADTVRFDVEVPEEAVGEFARAVADATHGKGTLEIKEGRG